MVEGLSGAGKTTVCDELQRRGHHAVHGGIQRFELSPSGNDANDVALRAALEETRRQFKLPPPPAVALSQPMRFRLSVRPQA